MGMRKLLLILFIISGVICKPAIVIAQPMKALVAKNASVTYTPMNLALWAQVSDGGSFGAGWDNDGITVTADQKNDLLGNPTLDKITITSSGANRNRQVIIGLTPGHL